MKKSAQKSKASTQSFVGITDIGEGVVSMTSGDACMIIEVQATNFALLSAEEQDIRVLSYSSLLNSLSFPIQVFIRSKKIDISSYLKLLDAEITKNSNPLLSNQIKLYKDFVSELVKVNMVLDKKFYIVIPYSYLESGIGQGNFAAAKQKLSTKAESLHAQLKRMGLAAKTLPKEELVTLFHEIYNGDFNQMEKVADGMQKPIVKAEGKV